jgi:glycosyltransferase involved in cell wall biosynthesis
MTTIAATKPPHAEVHVQRQPALDCPLALDDAPAPDRLAFVGPPAGPWALVEIVVPVYNEARDLERSIVRLRLYLDTCFPFPAMVTVADNASTDATWSVAQDLAGRLPGVRAVHVERKGRGGALRRVWTASSALVVAYMDVDLSTGLEALLPLVSPLLSGHSAVAIGSRLAPGARVARGPKRELVSRCYNHLVRAVLRSRCSDAQCGFKAMRADTARALLPLVKDNGWFFDTELLFLAQRNGLRVHEVAVDWVDDPDSRVDIVPTAWADLKGIGRLLLSRAGSRRGADVLGGPGVTATGRVAR